MDVNSRPYIGAGIILVRLGNAEAPPRFLCLCGRKTNKWSFSKGHPEQSDLKAPLRTAVRETYEETGYRAGIDYDIVGDSIRYGKRHYWVGVVRSNAPAVTIGRYEHALAGWFTAEEVVLLDGNTDVRAWAKKWACASGKFRPMIRAAAMVRGQQQLLA